MKTDTVSNGSSPDFGALATKFDKHDMARVIQRTPDQIEFALTDPDFPANIKTTAKRVIVAGMGGSALPADVIADVFARDLGDRLFVSRSYNIPWTVDRHTLVLVMSFSGGTEETLSALNGIATSDAQIIVITAGGKLEEMAVEADYPIIRIPKHREPDGFQPRCATGYFSAYVTRVLDRAGFLTAGPETLQDVATFLRSLDVRPAAKRLAEWLGNRIPLVYTDQMHENSVARITKIKLNENAKLPAFYNVLPEVNHNEMIGLSGTTGDFGLLYLRNPSSHDRIQKRYVVMRDVFEKRGLRHISFADWDLPGKTHADRVFAGLAFADWWSYYLALLGGVNPTPVALVEDFKTALTSSSVDIPSES